MKEQIIGYIVGFISFILLLVFSFYFIPANYGGQYTYEDLDGNIANADSCGYTDKSLFSGGQGTPICEIGNRVIQVKWYEKIGKNETGYSYWFK